MSEAKHTPGPWRVSPGMTYDADICDIIQRHIAERERKLRKKMLYSMLLSIAGIALAAWASWRTE